jgi:uncharacterized protein YcgI (DUF1989 family)
MTALTTSSLDPKNAVLDHTVLAGDPWIGRVQRGQTLRIVDLEGNQAVDTLFYSAEDLSDRYSASDTIRMQGALYLTTGSVLRSTSGSALLTTPWAVRAPQRATPCATGITPSTCTRAATAS